MGTYLISQIVLRILSVIIAGLIFVGISQKTKSRIYLAWPNLIIITGFICNSESLLIDFWKDTGVFLTMEYANKRDNQWKRRLLIDYRILIYNFIRYFERFSRALLIKYLQ